MSVTPELAIEDFVVSRIKVRKLYQLVFQNRVMAPLLEGVPGLGELVQLGKAYALAEERRPDGAPVWDHVIVDAPATGHGLTMLASPRLMMDVTGAGPFHDNAKLVHDAIRRSGPHRDRAREPSRGDARHRSEGALGAARARARAGPCDGVERAPSRIRSVRRRTGRPRGASSGKLGDTAVNEAVEMTDEWAQRAAIQHRLRRELVASIPVPLLGVAWSFARRLDRAVLEAMGAPLDALVLA